MQAAALAEDGEPVGGLLAEVSGAAADIDRAEVALFKCVVGAVPYGTCKRQFASRANITGCSLRVECQTSGTCPPLSEVDSVHKCAGYVRLAWQADGAGQQKVIAAADTALWRLRTDT